MKQGKLTAVLLIASKKKPQPNKQKKTKQKKNNNIGVQSDVYGWIWFKLYIIIDIIEFCTLMSV